MPLTTPNRSILAKGGRKPVEKPFAGVGGKKPQLLKSPKAQQLIQRLEGIASRVPEIPANILDRIKELLAKDPDGPLEQAREHALRLLERRRGMLTFGADILNRFRGGDGKRRFTREVLTPSAQGRMTSNRAWDTTNKIVLIDVLREVAKKYPGWTMGIGIVPEIGFILGAERTFGLAGMLNRQTVFYDSNAVGVGAYSELGFAFEAVFAPCAPTDLGGVSFGYDVGAAYGLGYTSGVGIKPRDLPRFLFPELFPPKLRVEDFDCITVGIPIGVGVEASIYADYTTVLPLFGPAEPEPVPPAAGPPPPAPLVVNAPMDLRETFPGSPDHGAARLTWIDKSYNEDGFYVERVALGSQSFMRVATISANVENFEEILQRGSYQYRVQAFRGSVVSGYSNVLTVHIKGTRRSGA